MKQITSENVKNSKFWNSDTETILMFDKTVGECKIMLIEIVEEYQDLLERLRDA